nr:hypothetical protein BaRGS_002255 [Batillaria attramentaria]
MPQNDCLGIDCDITIKNMFVSGKMSVNLRLTLNQDMNQKSLVNEFRDSVEVEDTASEPSVVSTHDLGGTPLELAKELGQRKKKWKSIGVELIPIELKLRGYVKIGVWIFAVKFSVTIWHWRASPIKGTIWQKEYRQDDMGPPRFPYCDRVSDQCDLKLWYAVGDYPGGTNVVGWTEMRGASLLVPAILPCGVPLYFLVRARNSQGLETTARCSIPTFDCTLPDGRVDAAYRPGRLTSTPKQTLKTESVAACASKCLQLVTCVSFTYNQYAEDCELQEVTEGPNAKRSTAENYETYERLGKSLVAHLRYTDLELNHGNMYYVNADVENMLGYHATLTSLGTMADFTPPEPGPAGKTVLDEILVGGCNASILQRCVDPVTSARNHRYLVVYYEAVDVISGIARVELGLGKTKYDVMVRGYSPYEIRGEKNTYLVNEQFGMDEGVAAWIRLKAVNNGRSPGKDDVVKFRALTSYDKQSCAHVQLQHNVTYFSTVIAYNRALNQESANASSDGGFYDPESGLDSYTLSVIVNSNVENVFQGLEREQFTEHSFSFHQGDRIQAQLQATNRAGGKVTVTSDGVLVDRTPPELLNLRAVNETKYQQRDDVLDFAWEFQDPESGIAEYRCTVFKFHQGIRSKFWPKHEEFQAIHLNETTPQRQELHLVGLSLDNGGAYSLKVTAMNRANMATSVESEGVIIDTTPPYILEVEERKVLYRVYVQVVNGAGAYSNATFSNPFIVLERNIAGPVLDGRGPDDDDDFSSDKASVAVTFSGFSSKACGIQGYEWGIGTRPSTTDVMPFTRFGLVVDDLGRGFAQVDIMQFEGQTYYSTVRAKTGHNCYEEYIVGSSDGFTVDTTPPVVKFYLDTHEVSSHQAVYQTKGDVLSVVWDVEDTSDGVVISPEPRLEVWDGPGDSDMDGQAELHVIQGGWRYSDPCPVLSTEWSVREISGDIVTDFSSVPGNGHKLYNDDLDLENLKTYLNYVRVTDALNRTFVAFSDGITVMLQRPDPATVRDGLSSNDVDFQEPTDQLSANWDAFGDAGSTLPSDHIVKYEAAVGTDRRHASTRSDVHAFEDITLSTNVTFHALNLTAKTATYYVTVRAYSGVGSYIESSSDGIKVGYTGDVKPGQIQVDRYQSSVRDIRFSWTEFESDMIITHYYAGVSTTAPPWDNSTTKCADRIQAPTFSFDIYPLQALSAQSVAVLDNLSLVHGGAYFVTLVAADKMGHCSAAVSEEIVVDTTPPVPGEINVDGTTADTVMFLHSAQTLLIDLDRFADPESGLKEAEIDLLSNEECRPGQDSLGTVKVKNETRVSMRNLALQTDTLYFLKAKVTNGAGLQTASVSRPLVLDTSPPLPGLVKLGSDWTAEEKTVQNETNEVKGMVALRPVSSSEDCVTKMDLFSSNFRSQWKAVEGEFEKNCVGFDASGLNMAVQHNQFLTGVDRELSEDETVLFLGNNHSVGVRWDISEDVSSVISVEVDLSPLRLNVTHVTVVTVSGVTLGLLDNTEHLELSLVPDSATKEKLDVEYYEWAIGTSRGKDDIFPRTIVGPKDTKNVAIVDGYFRSDNSLANVSIADFTKKNFSSDTPPDPSGNTFLMEPGRCLYQKLYGASKAHVLSSRDVIPGTFDFAIRYTDADMDEVEFALGAQPSHGIANVTAEGMLQYRPDPNYNGKDFMHVYGKEKISAKTQSLGVVPREVNFTVTVFITPVNDPPEIFYISGDSVLLSVSVTSLSRTEDKEIFVNLSEGYTGHVTYQARVKDAPAGTYSRQLTLGVYVLISPCLHGHCEPRTASHRCQEPQRAFTFGPYRCDCDLGYEGQWCETETNECRTATCSPITDCVDLIGGYRCDYNPTKLAAIIICSVLGFIILVFAIYKIRRRKS